jgi:hypothetical protein
VENIDKIEQYFGKDMAKTVRGVLIEPIEEINPLTVKILETLREDCITEESPMIAHVIDRLIKVSESRLLPLWLGITEASYFELMKMDKILNGETIENVDINGLPL